MFNLFGQAKAQIMIINSYEVQLFVWQNKTLTFLSHFTDSADDHDRLSQTLVNSSSFPIIIITNFMEESFLNETTAHVTGGDRKALLDRKLGYAFRTTPYRIAKITDREKDGRRDDKILLSALTKPELLKPWVKPLLDNKIPIQSITSVSYLAEAFAQSTGANKEEHLLLVSLENGSELRQTYLKKGQILFSRLTSLTSNSVTTSLGDDIFKESLQIRSYLERIRALPYDGILKVHIYSPFNEEALSINLPGTELNAFENFNTTEEAKAYSLELNDAESNAVTLFLAHTLQKKQMPNTYAPFNIRRYFHLNTISLSLKWFAAALVLVFIFLESPKFLQTLDNWDQNEQVISRTRPLVTEYEVLSRRFPETPIPSEEMALVVETYEVIEQQSYMLEKTLSIVSQALVTSPELKLTSINWELIEGESDVVNQGFGYRPVSNVDPDNAFQQAIVENRSILKVLVDGLSFSPSSYRAAQDQVLKFAEALESYSDISVELLNMPTDVRLDTSIQTTVDGDEISASFTLELTMEAGQ